MQIERNIVISGRHQRPILLDIYHPDTPQPGATVIFAHGFKGFKDWGHWDLLAREFAAAGLLFLKFNFSHNGTTPADPLNFGDLQAFGNNNFEIELDDLDTVIDFAVSRRSGAEDTAAGRRGVCLIGHSRGGGIVIIKAADDPRVKKIATWASVSDFGKYFDPASLEQWKSAGVYHVPNARTGQQMPLYYQFYENYRRHRQRFSIPDAARRLSVAHLIVHGRADETVPLSAAEELHRWSRASRLCLIENANHTFGGAHPFDAAELPPEARKLAEVTIDFFKES